MTGTTADSVIVSAHCAPDCCIGDECLCSAIDPDAEWRCGGSADRGERALRDALGVADDRLSAEARCATIGRSDKKRAVHFEGTVTRVDDSAHDEEAMYAKATTNDQLSVDGERTSIREIASDQYGRGA